MGTVQQEILWELGQIRKILEKDVTKVVKEVDVSEPTIFAEKYAENLKLGDVLIDSNGATWTVKKIHHEVQPMYTWGKMMDPPKLTNTVEINNPEGDGVRVYSYGSLVKVDKP